MGRVLKVRAGLLVIAVRFVVLLEQAVVYGQFEVGGGEATVGVNADHSAEAELGGDS